VTLPALDRPPANTAPTYDPTPRMMEVLSDPRLSPTSKVIYALLDEMGRGYPVGIQQQEIADLLTTSRRTVIARLAELRQYHYIVVTTHGTGDARTLTYRTRVPLDDISLAPIKY
jgi:hypothetical protein